MWKNSIIKFGFPINDVHHLRHMNNCASDSVSNKIKIPILSITEISHCITGEPCTRIRIRLVDFTHTISFCVNTLVLF